MRICLVEEKYLSPFTTGPSKHTNQLACALAKKGQDVLVICQTPRDQEEQSSPLDEPESERIEVVQLVSIGVAHQRLLGGFVRLIKEEHPDIVHSQGYRNLTTDLSALSSRLNGIPFVLSPRGSLLGFEHRGVESLVPVAARLYDAITMKRTLAVADAIVVTSLAEMRDALAIGVPSDRIKRIPHGMVFPKVPTRRNDLRGQPRLLTVGRITPRRNIAMIVESMKYVLNRYPEAVLYVAGEPIKDSYDKADKTYPDEVARLARQMNLRNHIQLLGGVYGEELWTLYSSSDAFVYASTYDNFGFGLLEAAYFGLPIASTGVGIAPDLIQGGKGGVVINHSDPKSIADAVVGLLEEPSMRQRMSEHLREVSIGYSIERNCEEYLKLYEDLVSQSQMRVRKD